MDRFTVFHLEQFIVDLNEMSCTCCEFQVDGMPCPHAIAAIRLRRNSPYHYCCSYYTTKAVQLAYAEPIEAVGSGKDWIIPDEVKNIKVLPPKTKRSIGRPRKTRILSVGEEVHHNKCGRCGQPGHNRQTCQNPISLNSRSNTKGVSSSNPFGYSP